MVDTADETAFRRSWKANAGTVRRVPAAPIPLDQVDIRQWQSLAARAVEPNGYYLPAWELAVNASARGRTGASALCAFADGPSPDLIGLLPVVPLWRTWKMPLPALLSAQPYGTLCTPLLDRELCGHAAARLLESARKVGVRALILRDVPLEGPAMAALSQQVGAQGLKLRLLTAHFRAMLDATQDADRVLGEALGAKRLKELRRQRQRLAEHGAVSFEVARTPDEIRTALETFLHMEASGWKGRRGTALLQHAGDAAFIRRAVLGLAETAQCEIALLRTGTLAVAGGIVLRHGSRAFFFKTAFDERFAKYSPGVQLTCALTRYLCADSEIVSADSTASADHPMIDRIWRGRLAVGDILIPLQPNDRVASVIDGVLALRQICLQGGRRIARWLRD